MLGKEWTREFFNEYVIWLEHTLFKLLNDYNNEVRDSSNNSEHLDDLEEVADDTECNKQELIDSTIMIKKKLESVGLAQKEEFIKYFLQSNEERRYPEVAFLLDANYIDNIDMNQFYFSILEQDEKIIIDQVDKIKGLKLLLSEFLYQCGYDSALDIQKKILNEKKVIKKVKNESKSNDRKSFDNIEVVSKDGEKKIITVFYGTLRGRTTWYAKRGKTSSKIEKRKNGKFIYMEGKKMMEIVNDDVIAYISKDYD